MIRYILSCIVESRSITSDYMERRSFLHEAYVAFEIFVTIRRDPISIRVTVDTRDSSGLSTSLCNFTLPWGG